LQVQPIDFVKVRLQLSGEGVRSAARASAVGVARDVIAKDGFFALYTGITAAYTRQIVYGSARLGLFRSFSDYARAQNNGRE
jgi:solute carrier family 25 oxoglutarate transporter 11